MRIAASWFECTRVNDRVTRFTEPYVEPVISANIWHVRGRDGDLLVDTGLGIASMRDAAGELFGREPLAVATHGHYDHIGGMHEWSRRAIHRLEAQELRTPGFGTLLAADIPEEFREQMATGDSGELLTAHPYAGFDPAAYRVQPAEATRLLDAGDVIELGDRSLEVLHLPGHSPGSIGLWDAASGTLFSGDVIYDGMLLDEIPGSDINDYVDSMRRLRALPVTIVHPGHGESFGRSRLIALADAYIEKRARAA